jgi:hypothetical protein
MGEGPNRVTHDGARSPSARVGRVSGEIEALRGQLGTLVAELDRRRQEAFDVRLQIRRHPAAVAVAAVGAALVVGGLIALAVRRSRKRHELKTRAREVRRAFGAIVKDPYNVARDSSLTEKLVATAGTTVVTLVVKRVLDQVLPPASARAPRPPRANDATRRASGTRAGFAP